VIGKELNFSDDMTAAFAGEPSHIWTRNFVLLCLANLMLFMSTNMLIPNLPRYLLAIGGSALDIGYVMAAYTIGAMFMRPFAGWLVDNYGRKRVLLLGMFAMLTVTLLYIPVRSVFLMLLVRGLHGVTLGLVSTAIATIVADGLPMNNFSEGMGYFGLISSLAMAVAPVLGFAIVGSHGYPYFFGTVIFLTTLAFASSMPVRSRVSPKHIPNPDSEGFLVHVLELSAWLPATMHFCLALVFGATMSFVSLHAAQRGVSNIGWFFTAWALTMLLTRPLSGRWADRGSGTGVLFIGHLALLIGMITTALAQGFCAFLLSGAIIGIGFGFNLPTLQALAVRDALIHRRGSATATFYIASDLGIGLGTIMAGYIATASSYQFMYFTTLLPIIASITVYYKYGESAIARVSEGSSL